MPSVSYKTWNFLENTSVIEKILKVINNHLKNSSL